MRPTILKLSLILFLGNLLLPACRKHDDLKQPEPQNPPPVLSYSFQLTIDALPGEPNGPVNNLSAIVTAVNEKNETVLNDRKLAVSFDGKFKTPEVKLPKGDYRITKFLIVNENNHVRFATPVINSAKASSVSKPLPVAFILPQPVLLNVGIEVLKVASSDTPESFGYPAGTFNQPPGNPEEPATVKIKMRLAIQVGAINYDSIPGTALYSIWNETQQTSAKYITLAAGVNELTLERAPAKHHFRITKWGKAYELTILKKDLKEGETYIFGGSKEAKKLKSEITFKLVGSAYVAESKNSYTYQPDGKLSAIDYYLRKADNSPYLAKRDVFQYSNGKVERINRYDENNKPNGHTAFTYDGSGKVNSISDLNNGVSTNTTVIHFPIPEEGITEVTFNYQYSNTPLNFRYSQRYLHGNLFRDAGSRDNHDNETGEYDYDTNINPYAHMGWPNLFMSNDSKNNMVFQRKQFHGSYREVIPFKFEYKYDAEGYPMEVITHYRSYVTNQFLYTTKTTFTY